MDRLFLDANVIFSAAWREDAAVVRLWELENVVLLTSTHAVEEAERNLPTQRQRDRLKDLLEGVEIVKATALDPSAYEAISLPTKDWPILGGAVAARATHLITADVRHFGAYFGQRVLGILVLPPARYIRYASRDS